MHVIWGIPKKSPRSAWRSPNRITTKTAMFAQLRLGMFSSNIVRPLSYRARAHFFGIPHTTCRTRDDYSFSQHFSSGPRYVAIRKGRWRPNRPKMGNDCVKKGGGPLPLNYPLYLYLNLNGDSEYAIKYDSIRWSDQVPGVQCWPKIHRGPKISM